MMKLKSSTKSYLGGAILSDYQRYRIENVTFRLGLRSLCFLWQRRQQELLEDIISAGIEAIIIKIASFGLTIENFLGFRLSDVMSKLCQLSTPPWSLNVCGEGGEFETITLDCPIFHSRIQLTSEPEIVIHSKDPFSPTAYLCLRNLQLEAKPLNEICQTAEQILSLGRKCVNEDGSLHKRPPFISPFERLQSIQVKTCEEIKNDLCNVTLQERNIDGSSDSHYQIDDKTEQKSIKDIARPIGNGVWITSNYYGISDRLDKIRIATENAFNQMRNVLDSKEIKPHQIVQFIVVLSHPLSSDVFNSFNQAYTHELSSWLNKVKIDHPNLITGDIDLYMPTRVCICMNSPTNDVIDCSEEAFTINLSAILYFGDINICEWINSLHGLYVQSISHWAPANIGPYSQAIAVPISNIQLDDCSTSCVTHYFTFYSGQIGLIPELEALPTKSGHFPSHFDALQAESWLSLRHCHRLMKYMSPTDLWMNLFLGICYAADESSLSYARNCFHQAVCLQTLDITDTYGDTCHCNKCVVWFIVSNLPKNASVEWQWITGPSTALITSMHTALNDKSIIPTDTFMLFYRHDNSNQLNKQNLSVLLEHYSGFIMPVVKFADPSTTAVVISVQPEK
ncbi:Diphthine--ammonia ligase isoform 3 [Schistosoma japonicum]|uniref:Diphthine--ammonia ligase n=3 Tax=Schistosoma japonicum TaxID=6182 RepID=A0A4Z2DH67_SCHJA|nr:Diphthine--ammonia ligase isoform 3 [Schistosoma japonicum]